VSGTYFETMGTRVVRGRPLTERDDEGTPRVVVVSASLAQALWPGADALGRCLRLGADTMPCSDVVGVAETIRRGDIRRDADRQYYVTWRQYYGHVPSLLLVRTYGPAARVAKSLRSQLQAATPDAFVQVRLLDEVIAPQTKMWREGVRIFSCFGLLSLGLAAFGLFTVVHYDAAQRHREFGVRVALGARRGGIVRLVLGRGGLLAGWGVALGVGVSWVFAPRVQTLLFDIGPHDAPAFLGAVVVIAVAASAAGLGPALRAAAVDPQEALRGD